MSNLDGFLKKLDEEIDDAGKEEVSKHLAKEDSLRFVADFVEKVKGKFSKQADQVEILEAAEKTLRFYIDEIEGNNDATIAIGFDNSDESPKDNYDDEEENFE